MSQRPCYSRLQSTPQHTPPIYLSAPTPIYSPIYSSAHLPSLLNHLRHAPLNLAAFHNMLVINLLVNASLATAASPTLDPLHTPVKKLRRFSHFRSPPLPARRQPARHQPCRRRLTRRRRSLTFRRAPQDTLVIYAALAQNLCPAPLLFISPPSSTTCSSPTSSSTFHSPPPLPHLYTPSPSSQKPSPRSS